jgi:ribosome-binding factor A
MTSIRQNKISRLIQKELGEIFVRQAPVYFSNSLISVTVVRMSPDFALARVYLSIFSNENTTENVFELIQFQKKMVRNLLGQKIKNQVRIIPELAFFIDDSVDYFNRIEELLKK